VLELQAVFIQTPNGCLAEGSAIEGDHLFGHRRVHQANPEDSQSPGTLHGFKATGGRARRQLAVNDLL
jgi:hypothetical protein